ncbi:MAG: hypothetical protein FWC96_10265 [Oscillospiraceae bacterium]|nr:hypothetical protein [Oscillospiraceae bacterium]
MSVSRIKNIAIAALCLINGFFLAFIITDSGIEARNERQELENISAILLEGGITLDTGGVQTRGELRTMRTVRDIEAEAGIARAVLGQTYITEDGGMIYVHRSDRGMATFSSAGFFEINLYENVITNVRGTMQAAESLLGDMGIETSRLSLSGGVGYETVSAVSAYRGSSVFNGVIDFIFIDGSLRRIEGTYITGVEDAEDGETVSSVSTALLDFLAWVRKGETDSTRIYSVEAGFFYREAGRGEGVLTPTWLISADNGRQYLIDDATGEIWLAGRIL